MTSEERQPIPPEDAYTELLEEDDVDLEELILEAVPSATPTAAVVSADLEEAKAQIEKLQQDLKVAQQTNQEQEERYLRLFADFENFRRRTQREKEEQGQREKSKFVLEILPVVDNFERAQQQVKLETDRERSLHESYQSVYRLLVDCLKKMGVSRLKATGQPFDPNLHEAIARQASNEFPEDTVMVEYQAGYKLGEKVIRHAMVSVSVPGDDASAVPAPMAAHLDIAPEASEADMQSDPVTTVVEDLTPETSDVRVDPNQAAADPQEVVSSDEVV